MPVNLDSIGTETEPSLWSWRPRDCSLYALALGAGFRDRAFVLDATPGVVQKVYPTFMLALVSADSGTRKDELLGAGDFTGRAVVLGEQVLEVHAPIEPTGEVSIRWRLGAIYDKGSGAVVVLEAKGSRPRTDEVLFSATMNMFVVGEGGFGGERGPGRAQVNWPPGPPNHVRSVATLPVHSLLYRHAGNDVHGTHVDPEAARSVGFEAPILTGQNTLGIACRAIAEAVTDSDPERIAAIRGRFATPALNGDLLTTEIWVADDRDILFRVVNQDGQTVIDGGSCSLRGRPANLPNGR